MSKEGGGKHGIWAVVRGVVKWPPETRQAGGKTVTNFRLDVKMRDGVQSVKAATWEEVAEAASDIRKGDEVEVAGWLKLTSWVNKDKVTVWENAITAVEVAWLDREPARVDAGRAETGQRDGTRTESTTPSRSKAAPVSDDDIPF